MSVNLRDRLFSDTGGVVQNAIVQAILVTGGGTDVGTSSIVQASTTTDSTGMWKFSALPDPGAGNWYDVKITNGNQVRWRYGNIQAVLASLQLQSTVWASPHFTSPVVDSGNLTLTSGNLIIGGGGGTAAGMVGFSGTALQVGDGSVARALYIGSWTAFTPGISQPTALTNAVNWAHYALVGKLVTVQIQMTLTQAGTAANDIFITGIPAAIAPATTNADVVVGTFRFHSSPIRVGCVLQPTSTTLKFGVDNTSGYMGTSPSLALANGDTLTLVASWEIA